MVFSPPAWVPKLPFDPPDSITLAEFWGNEKYGRQPVDRSRNPFTCGITGKTYAVGEMRERYELLARGLAKRLGWRVNADTPWDKVVCVYSFNSIDYLMATYAAHRLNGIATPANAAYSASELAFQLRSAGAKALVTCVPLLATAREAAEAVGIPPDRIYLMETALDNAKPPYASLDDLIGEGRLLPALEPLAWTKGQGSRQVAYLFYSSGTSGLPKAVMVSHRNIIANVMQIRWHESVGRREKGIATQVSLGLLPLSHIYGFVIVAQSSIYRGDNLVVLPRFELKDLLTSIEKYKINYLYLVPPVILQLLGNREVCNKYDLSSVRHIYTGAAPLGAETHLAVVKAFPGWQVGQGYGMTETGTVALSTGENDIMVGTAGSLVPECFAKLVDEDGHKVTGLEQRGELWIRSPAVTLGYLNNAKATAETYVDDDDGRWVRTGDVAVVRRSAAGHEHFAIVDRLKELIKVKGHQVAPAELEAHLLTHPYVSDCAVIPVPDERAGEVPKAFVVKSAHAAGKTDAEVARDICKHVEDHKSRYKWLKGGVKFVEIVPKSPSGKILRRVLKEQEREARRAKGARL